MPAETILVRLKTVGAKKFSADMEEAAESTEQLRDEFGRFLPTGKKANKEMGGLKGNAREAGKALKALGVVLAFVAGGQAMGAMISATGALGVALLGLVAATGGAALVLGGFAIGAVAAFKSMAKQGGSAAAELSKKFGDFKQLVGKELGPAFIPVFQAMTRALGPLGNLVRQIAPAFAVLGRAVARGVDQFAAALPALGPRISSLLRGVATMVPTLVTLVIRLTRIFLDLANAALPYLNRGLEWLNGQLGKLSSADIAGGVAGSFQTLGKVMAATGRIIRAIGPPIMSVIHKAGELGNQLIEALKPAMPFWQNVLWPLIKGIGQGIGDTLEMVIKVIGVLAVVLGAIGSKLGPVRGAFQSIGRVIGWFVTGPVFSLLGKIPKIGFVFRAVGTVVNVVGKGLGKALGLVGRIVGRLVSIVGGAVGKVGGAARRVGSALVRPFVSVGAKVVGVVRSGFGSVVRFITGLVGKFGSLAGRAVRALVRPFGTIGSGIAKVLSGAASTVFNAAKGLGTQILKGIATPLKSLGKIPVVGGALKKLPFGAGSLFQAKGGVMTKPGLSWVGEQGPELVSLPAGATTYPAAESAKFGKARPLRANDRPASGGGRAAPFGGQASGGQMRATVPVNLVLPNGRAIASLIADVMLERETGTATA